MDLRMRKLSSNFGIGIVDCKKNYLKFELFTFFVDFLAQSFRNRKD